MLTGSEMAFEAFAVAKGLALFVILYALLVITAFILIKGREAGMARSCIVLFTGAFVVGGFLANLWLMMGMTFPYGSERDYLPLLTLGGALYTGPLLRRITWIMGGLAGHALIYLVWALRQLDPLKRNRIAIGLLVPAVAIALYSPLPQIRFWKRIYNADNMRAAIEWHNRALSKTDFVTAKWVAEDETDWRSLLLRANHLYESRRSKEAVKVDGWILELPRDEVPEGLREFIQRRLKSANFN